MYNHKIYTMPLAMANLLVVKILTAVTAQSTDCSGMPPSQGVFTLIRPV